MQQKEYLATLIGDLKNLVTSETVIGEPIVIGAITILPVVNITFGFGSGGSEKNAEDAAKAGGGLGAGAGAKICPIAFLVVNGDQVTMLQVQNQKANTSLDRLIDLMPGLVDKVSNQFMKKQKKVTDTASEAAFHQVAEEIKQEAAKEAAKEAVKNPTTPTL